jgi:DNA invertase Pin-like site-specific DNA recombinase
VIVIFRPADALLRGVRSDRFEIVLASSLHGLGRSVPSSCKCLGFIAHKTVLIVPGRFDTSKLSSKVFLDTLDAIEEFKHAATVEAINEGLAAAKTRGIKLGRRRTLDAYRGRGPIEGARADWSRYRKGAWVTGWQFVRNSSTLVRRLGQLDAASQY